MLHTQLTSILTWLENAPQLSEDAFSWQVTPPTIKACSQATQLVKQLKANIQQATPTLPLPLDTKIIAGPITSGGIGLELTLTAPDKPLLQIFLSFYNDYPLEVEYGVNKQFEEVSPLTGDPLQIVKQILQSNGY